MAQEYGSKRSLEQSLTASDEELEQQNLLAHHVFKGL
jgi:hypothetical protein